MSETKTRRRPKTADLLTIDDLADRWGGSLAVVKRLVRSGSVPFFSLVPTDLRIEWSQVRFRLDAIVEYERRRSVAFEDQSPAKEPEVAPKRNQAGDWDWRR
jgi:hypothetical protein